MSIRGLAVASSAAVAVAGLTVGINVITARADEPATAAAQRAPVAAAERLGITTTAGTQLADIQAVADTKADKRRAAEKRLAEKRRKAEERHKAEAQAAAARAARERASRAAAPQTFSGDVRGIAAQISQQKYGWGSGQFSCLNSLWEKESGWNYRAANPSSGAYGIPQALPGSKMGSAGSDWATNPATQIEWGLGYIADRYGTPCGAWGHSESVGWY